MYGLIANVVSDRMLRAGAKVWIHDCNGDAECPIVSGLNKFGRNIQKYTQYKKLTNFRAAWIPEHMRSNIVLQFATKEEAKCRAERLSIMWAGIRQYSHDGKTLLREGEAASAAFDRARLLNDFKEGDK